MPGFPGTPSIQTVTDTLANMAPAVGNVPGYYVWMGSQTTGVIYGPSGKSDNGGNVSVAAVPAGIYNIFYASESPTGTAPTRWQSPGVTGYLVALSPPPVSVKGTGGLVYDTGGQVLNIRTATYTAIGTWNPDVYPGGDCSGAVNQASIDLNAKTNGVGGTLYFPQGTYGLAASIVPKSNIEYQGVSGYTNSNPPIGASLIALNAGTHVPCFAPSGSTSGVKIRSFSIVGNAASGDLGISASLANEWELYDLFFNQFGDEAVKITSGTGGAFDRIFIQNSLLVRTGRGSLVGCFTFGGTDAFLTRITSTASIAGGDGTGNICGILLSGTNNDMDNCVGHISQIGIAVTGASNRVTNCRADLNNGQGWEVDGFRNQFTNCTSYKDSQALDNGRSGWVTTNGGNVFVNCGTNSEGIATQPKNGFDDNSTSSAINQYIGCWVFGIRGVPYSVLGTTAPVIIDPVNIGVTALVYSAAIASDAAQGEYFTIAATNGTAFTISNPTNSWKGKLITYEILNSSGGAMGVVTWGANFLLAGAFVNPANTKRRTIQFRNNGTNHVEVTRAAADI